MLLCSKKKKKKKLNVSICKKRDKSLCQPPEGLKTINASVPWRQTGLKRLCTHLERKLCGEGELVLLEEAARRVDEDGVGDAVDEVEHARLHLLRRLGAVDRLVEHHAKRLQNTHNSLSLIATRAWYMGERSHIE